MQTSLEEAQKRLKQAAGVRAMADEGGKLKGQSFFFAFCFCYTPVSKKLSRGVKISKPSRADAEKHGEGAGQAG